MHNLLSMRHINKAFFGVNVLHDVNFDLSAGEAHILLGENGAGKSTLIKILSGAYRLDSGEILIENASVNPHTYTPKDANERGIVTIYQNFHLVPHLSVAENISLSDFATTHGIIRWKELYKKAEEVLQTIQFSIHPKRNVQDLSVSEKQMLEIAIALSKNAKILIMDEPTAAISKKETEILFALIHEIKTKGIGIIYISHKLEEIQQIGDRLTILRDGRHVSTLQVNAALHVNTIVNLMTGKDIRRTRTHRTLASLSPFIEISQFSSPGKFDRIDFTIQKGEILGLTGLVGSGKTELARALFGADPFEKGRILINGTPASIRSPSDAIRHGLGYLPEDRDVHGLCLNMPVKDNISLVFLAKLHALLFSNKREKHLVHSLVNNLRIKTTTIFQYVKYLSGGNKQKVIFAKWLSADCQLLLLDEPTIGIDVGAREEIYGFIHDFVRTHEKSVLFISSDIHEILNISDRILVMARGRIRAEIDPQEATTQQIMEHCLAV